MRRAAALALAAALLSEPGASAGDSPAPHRVDTGKRFQMIDHFGASDCWTTKILGSWTPAARARS